MDGSGNTPIRPRTVPRSSALEAAARTKRPASDRVHPAVYWVIVGLAGWLVLSVWGFLGSGYAGLALAVVTIFIVIAVTLWLAHEFDVDAGRMKATVAAMEILLPIAAVAFGMTIFALVRYFDGVV
jgi:hypothetical protein